MPTFPLPTLSAQITTSGISAPSYADILTSLQTSYQSIFGSDIYIAPDSQDGQFLALIAAAIHDNNQAMIATYQSYSPTFAQGVGLSSQVKLNGLQRLVPTHSTAVGSVIGQAGTVIVGGVVKDGDGNKWDLPASVTVPVSGQISVTVIAQKAGAIQAGIGLINEIESPVLGWQSFSNTSAAVVGSPVESDAQLRSRQSISTALPATSNLDSMLAGLGNVVGVQRFAIYENDTGATDANGVPAHSVAPVVSGGSLTDIVEALAVRKPPGIQTFGSVSGTYIDQSGMPAQINYHVLTVVPVFVTVTITALPGYTAATGSLIINSIVEFINKQGIGEDLYYTRLFAPANLAGQDSQNATGLLASQLFDLSETYHTNTILVGFSAGSQSAANLVISYNAAASISAANVTLTVI